MTTTIKGEARSEFVDVAPLVKGFLAFVVRGANRLVEIHKDKEQLDTLEKLIAEFATSDRSQQTEILETVLEILLPDEFVGGMESESGLGEDAKDKAETWRIGVGDRICRFRKERGWTQDDLAKAARIPQSHVCRLEKGQHAPTHVTIGRIANALEVQPSKLDPNYPSEMEMSDSED